MKTNFILNRKFALLVALAIIFVSVPTLFFGVKAQQSGGNRPRQATSGQATPTPLKPNQPATLTRTATPTPTPFAQPTNMPRPSTTPTPEVVDDDTPLNVDVNNVVLNVRLVDREGRTVTDVKSDKAEFQVFENGVPQPIETISREEVPINYGLLIDNSGSLRSQLEKVIDASKIIINSNKPEDETFVIRFVGSDNIKLLQDFTAKKEDLTDALDDLFSEGGQTAIRDAVYLGAEHATEYEKLSTTDDKKRRALVIITDGDDRSSVYDDKQLFDFLKESAVQIYVVGFTNELTEDKSVFGRSPKQKAVAFLNRLATETGGKAYFPANLSELNTIARDIASELRTQYILSYAPTNDKRDGTYRAIRVAVRDDAKRGKRIALTRPGYTAKADKNLAPVSSKPTPKN